MGAVLERILRNLVRFGKVTKLDSGSRKVIVSYPDKGTESDWLFVLKYPGLAVGVQSNGDHTHEATEGVISSSGLHDHVTVVTQWMPKVGDKVLVLHLPIRDADGFVLGVIA